jgi:arylsulfatase A-like enzyme
MTARCRRSSALAALMMLLIAAVPAAGAEPAKAAPRNVILISLDTLRADAVTAADAPTLTRLAAASAAFSNAYTTAPWTLPAHASMMTGLYPDRHGAMIPESSLSADFVTLAEVLRVNGYETIAFTGSGFVNRALGFGDGFVQYDVFAYADARTRPWVLPRDGNPDEVSIAERFDRGIAYLRQRQSGDPPFFLFLHTFAVHDYFQRRSSVDEAPECSDSKPAYGYIDCLRGRSTCTASEWQLLRDCYRTDLRHVDGDLSRLLAVLREAGLADSTLLVITSDHGEGFDPERERVHHAGRLHADVLRIPLLFHGPGVAPAVHRDPASLIDLLPTVVAYVGLPIPPGLDGTVLPLGAGAAAPPQRTLYAMEYGHWMAPQDQVYESAVHDAPLGLAVIADDAWYIRGPDGEQIYTLDDAEQRRALSDTAPNAGALRALADARNPPAPAAIAKPQLDDAHAERLRALGYAP